MIGSNLTPGFIFNQRFCQMVCQVEKGILRPSDDDVDEFAWDDDDFADMLVSDELVGILASEGSLSHIVICDIGRNGQLVTDLAVDLDHEGHFLGLSKLLVESWPGGRMDASLQIEDAPELLTEKWRERRKKAQHRCYGFSEYFQVDLGLRNIVVYAVDQFHDEANGSVESEFLDVAGDVGNGPMREAAHLAMATFARIETDLASLALLHEWQVPLKYHPPNAAQEPVRSFDPLVAPVLAQLGWTHEQHVQP